MQIFLSDLIPITIIIEWAFANAQLVSIFIKAAKEKVKEYKNKPKKSTNVWKKVINFSNFTINNCDLRARA